MNSVGESSFDPDILSFYSTVYNEAERIRSGIGELELIRTRENIRRNLPSGRLDVLDVGGGSGVHAEWLLGDGHRVTLVDPVPRHVDEATARLGSHRDFEAEIGGARQLDQPDESFDAVLLLGPLYHLVERSDRLRSWREAMRVSRTGGIVFAVGISRFAELSVGLGRGPIFDDDFRKMMKRTLSDGQHRSPTGKTFFTTAFYHHPDELIEEATETGWHVSDFFNIEGFIEPVPAFDEHWADPVKRQIILEASRLTETEPTLRGLGPHMTVVATKHG